MKRTYMNILALVALCAGSQVQAMSQAGKNIASKLYAAAFEAVAEGLNAKLGKSPGARPLRDAKDALERLAADTQKEIEVMQANLSETNAALKANKLQAVSMPKTKMAQTLNEQAAATELKQAAQDLDTLINNLASDYDALYQANQEASGLLNKFMQTPDTGLKNMPKGKKNQLRGVVTKYN